MKKTHVSFISFLLILFLPFVLKNLTTFRVQEEPVLITEQDQGFEFCTFLYLFFVKGATKCELIFY